MSIAYHSITFSGIYYFTHNKLKRLNHTGVFVVPAPELTRQQQQGWLAPRGLPDWLGCCYLMQRDTSEVALNPLPWQISLTTYTFSRQSVRSRCARVAAETLPLLRVDTETHLVAVSLRDVFQQQTLRPLNPCSVPNSSWQHPHPRSLPLVARRLWVSPCLLSLF